MEASVRDYLNEVVFASVDSEVLYRDNCLCYDGVGEVGNVLSSVITNVVTSLVKVGNGLSDGSIEAAERMYYDKPLQLTGKTWTEGEYTDQAFQFVFVAHKLVRRVAMTSELFVRSYNLGVIREVPKRLVCVGSGPGIESKVFCALYQHFFGRAPNTINIDQSDWGQWYTDETFVRQEWHDFNVEEGDQILTSFVLEHYVRMPIEKMVSEGHQIFSIEKDYFPRLPCFKNMCDQTGRDKTHGVYCDYSYSHDHFHREPMPFQLRRSTGIPAVRSWEQINSHRGRNRVKDVRDHVSTHSGIVLDWGAGDGRITSQMRTIANEVYGVDVDPQFPGCYTPDQIGSVVEDESVDLVTMFMTLHHVEDVEGTLAHVHRVLKKNGYLYIRDHDADKADVPFVYAMHILEGAVVNEDWVGYMHLRPVDRWRRILRGSGFDILEERCVRGPTGIVKIACVKRKRKSFCIFDDVPTVPTQRAMYDSLHVNLEYAAMKFGYERSAFSAMLVRSGTFSRVVEQLCVDRGRLLKKR